MIWEQCEQVLDNLGMTLDKEEIEVIRQKGSKYDDMVGTWRIATGGGGFIPNPNNVVEAHHHTHEWNGQGGWSNLFANNLICLKRMIFPRWSNVFVLAPAWWDWRRRRWSDQLWRVLYDDVHKVLTEIVSKSNSNTICEILIMCFFAFWSHP